MTVFRTEALRGKGVSTLAVGSRGGHGDGEVAVSRPPLSGRLE